MEIKEMLTKVRSIKLCLMAHPDNEEHSEFADRISDLKEIEEELKLRDYSIDPNEPKSRCCGRCDGIDDLCVADMFCEAHGIEGCETCYGER